MRKSLPSPRDQCRVMGQPSPLRGAYLVQNPLWRGWLSASDAVLRRTAHPPMTPSAVVPRRVLIAVGGHLGDAVIATRALVEMARALPDAEIGVLTGSWNRQVFDGHSKVRWLHEVDHWKLNRVATSFSDRWVRYRRTRNTALREIRDVGYGAAVDLYAYYPNSAPILAASAIPRRIGFSSGGYGPLYTQELKWEPSWKISDDHSAAIGALVPGFIWDETSNYSLPDLRDDELARWRQRRQTLGIAETGYVVLHPGAGAPHKHWVLERWIEVARRLVRTGVAVVLTGNGKAQQGVASVISGAVPELVNLCGELSWRELRCVIAEATMLLSVDTVAIHLAAAAKTPCVALVTGIDAKGRWLPRNVVSLTHPVPCSPCFRSSGCNDMSCIRDVSVETVIAEAGRQLRVRAS